MLTCEGSTQFTSKLKDLVHRFCHGPDLFWFGTIIKDLRVEISVPCMAENNERQAIILDYS